MAAAKNRQILLAGRPHGEPTPDAFRLVESEICDPGPGQMLVRTLYLSLDPYMHGRMNSGPSYVEAVEVGAVMQGGAVCEVVKSSLPQFKPGDIVLSMTGWQDYALCDGKGVRKVDPALGPISYSLGVLGMPGMTAYVGLLDIGYRILADTSIRLWHIGTCRYGWEDAGMERPRFATFTLNFIGAAEKHDSQTANDALANFAANYPWPTERPDVAPPADAA